MRRALLVAPVLVVGSSIAAFAALPALLGLIWGAAAWRSRSIFGSTLSHILTDFIGLGSLAYLP